MNPFTKSQFLVADKDDQINTVLRLDEAKLGLLCKNVEAYYTPEDGFIVLG